MTTKSKSKEYQQAYGKEYNSRLDVKDRVKKYKKKYRKENEEKIKIYKKEYRQKNKAQILKYNQSPKVKAYFKEYSQKPEVIKKRKIYAKMIYQKKKEERIKKYGEKTKECIECHKLFKPNYNQKICSDECRVKRKAKKKIYKKEYGEKCWGKNKNNPKYKKMKRDYQRHRRQKDKGFAVEGNLRTLFYIAFKLYSTTGKIMNSKRYGVDFKAIINHIGPKPEDGNIYELDHIIPLCKFNHDDSEQVKKAWAPTNCQWLTKEINRWKNDRLIKPLTNEEKAILQKKLTNNP